MLVRATLARVLLPLIALWIALHAATAEAKVYAIIVIPTWAKGWLGEYSANDLDALTSTLNKLSAPKDLKILPLPRTWDQTLETIRDCPAGADDAIAVFFSGHGAYNERDGHFLLLPNAEGEDAAGPNGEEPLCTRTAIRKALEAKKVRLAVIMSNCCFNYLGPIKRELIVGAPPPTDESSPLFTALFLKSKGFVDITSCQRDRTSAGNRDAKRSIFVNSVTRVMTLKSEEPLDWEKFFLVVRDSANAEFKMLYPNGQKNEDGTVLPEQIALAFRLPGDTALDRAGPRFGVKGFGTNGRGVRIGEVFKGFPGEVSGLQIGDVIVEINGRQINYEQDYDKAIDASAQDMQLVILRNGRRQELGVRLRY